MRNKAKKESSQDQDSLTSQVDSWLKQAAVATPLKSFQNFDKESLLESLVKKGTLGPYRLLEVLGQGGMGIVWRAKHQETNALVALKTLRFPKAKLSRFIRREMRMLTKIQYPGIVRIVDEGIVEGFPYYAMELIIGQTLRQWCNVLPSSSQTTLPPSLSSWWTLALAETKPALSLVAQKEAGQTEKVATASVALSEEKLETFLTLIRRICETLLFLHGEGLVHRDLKPENILVGANGLPTLVDFGIAHPFVGQESSRERLSVEESLLGTSEYMSPEQIERKPLDARSDLYSLGVILFELLTGQRPFSGKTSRDVLHAHLFAPVPSLASFAPHLPIELDTLLARLLSKKPQERLGYASDVTQVLEKLGAKPWHTPLPKTRSYLYRPRFLGQSSFISQLKERLLLLANGKEGGLVLLGGESGVGKTRLLTELAIEAVQQKIRVVSGECLDTPIKSSLIAFRGTLLAIMDQCLEKGSEETNRLLGKKATLLARYESALKNLPGFAAYPEPAELPAQAAKFRLFSFLQETLIALANEKPLLLILDDLQWADELSLEFLMFSLKLNKLPKNVLLIGTYRTEEVGGNLEKLLIQQPFQKQVLDRLKEEGVSQLIGDMLALSPPPPRFSRFLYEQSEGNPFFVAELLRLAVKENLLWRDKTGYWQIKESNKTKESTHEDYESLGLPQSLKTLILRRLDRLSLEGRELIEVAAVLGKEQELSLLEKISQRALTPLEELLQSQVLENSSSQSVRFSHDKLREVALEYIEENRKQMLHQIVALALEDTENQEPGVLGYHWEQAEKPEQARLYYLKGAKQAQEGFHHQAAEQLYHSYFRLTPLKEPSEESIDARNAFGEKVLEAQGKITEAMQVHTLALKEARHAHLPHLEAQSLRLLGITSWRNGQIEDATKFCQQALTIARSIEDQSLEGRCLGDLAIVHRSQGSTEAEQLFEQALTLHQKLGNRRLEAACLGNLAGLYLNQAKSEKAKQLFQQAVDITREIRDPRMEGICLGNLATLYDQEGKSEKAKQLFQQAIAIHRELRNRRSEGVCLGSLALLYSTQKKIEEAEQLFEQALNIHRETENRRFEGICLFNLGTLYLDQGKIEKTKQLFEQALTITQEIGNRRVEGACLGRLGEHTRWESGDQEVVEKFYTQGEQILRKVGDLHLVGIILCERGHLLLWQEKSAKDILVQIKAIMAKIGEAQNESEIRKKLDFLTKAQDVFMQKGSARLFRGYRMVDIPVALREFLVKTGQLAEKDALLST